MQYLTKAVIGLGILLTSISSFSGRLALVIDDFGYRPTEEHKILQISPDISVSVLPDAPYSRQIALLAHQRGHEVLIHLPMAPISQQPLEINTLTPDMSDEKIRQIIQHAARQVHYAAGLNNHMGSRMTSSYRGMMKVMQALNHYNLYFLDSVTIGNTQAGKTAKVNGVRALRRNIFLDDSQNDADIRVQLQRAIMLAQKNGSAIAIGHPHPATVRVLQQMLPNLPADITLVRPSQLLSEAPASSGIQYPVPYGQQCKTQHPPATLRPADGVNMIYIAIKQSQWVQEIRSLW